MAVRREVPWEQEEEGRRSRPRWRSPRGSGDEGRQGPALRRRERGPLRLPAGGVEGGGGRGGGRWRKGSMSPARAAAVGPEGAIAHGTRARRSGRTDDLRLLADIPGYLYLGFVVCLEVLSDEREREIFDRAGRTHTAPARAGRPGGAGSDAGPVRGGDLGRSALAPPRPRSHPASRSRSRGHWGSGRA